MSLGICKCSVGSLLLEEKFHNIEESLPKKIITNIFFCVLNYLNLLSILLLQGTVLACFSVGKHRTALVKLLSENVLIFSNHTTLKFKITGP